MKPLAKRVSKIKPSPTLVITAKAKALKAQGLDVIGFGAGEPDFDTPANIKAAAIKAINDGQTKYTAVEGIVELRKAIQAKLKNDNNLDYGLDEILVSAGGKHSLYNIAQVLFNEGDEVIIPAPYWVSYPDQVLLNDATPIAVLATDQTGFKITPAQLEKAITPKSKAIYLNSPSNPTGAAYSREELLAIGEVCVKHDLYIISDEIYEKVIYDGFTHVSIASLSPALKERTLVVNGASKVYSMTGWRMGFTAGPKNIIKSMTEVQGQVTSNISSITQFAALEAYTGSQEAITKMVSAFKERRDYIVEALNTIPGIRCAKPQGAFYVFPNISALLGKKTPKGKVLTNDEEFCAHLLDDHLVAIVAGGGFGAPGFVRLSYATSMDAIKKGVERLKKAVSELS